jgi:membrane-associated phospholipid phosphatase
MITPPDPAVTAPRRPFVLTAATAILLGWFVSCAIDRAAYHALRVESWATEWATKDLVQMLRSAGYFPTWLLAGIMIDLGGGTRLWPSDFVSRHARRGVEALGARVMLSAALGGLLAELLKLAVRRHRPSPTNDGHHVYDWFAGEVEGRGLGLASSHAGVAFGAAFALWRWSPAAGWAALALALGCSATRLLSGAHFVSDVYAAAVLAWAGAGLIWWMLDRPARRRGA